VSWPNRRSSPRLVPPGFCPGPALPGSGRGGGWARRFGLTDGQPKTLDEIGKVYGVTRERIRQIESKTMSKLRHPSRSQVLRDYLD